MCGLAGYFTDCKVSDYQRLRRANALDGLLMANAQRGTDATGVGLVRNDGSQTIYKRAISSYRMVEDKDFGRIIRDKNARLALGHTRWKTHGANKDRNAHPFAEGDVTGAHNGVVWNYAELEKAIDGYKPLRVDSQIAFRLINEVAAKGEKIAKVLPMMMGQLALTWYDKRDPDALYVFRHNNPLHMAVLTDTRCAFWSSEYSDLAVVMQSVYGDRWHSHTIKEDTLYRFFYGESGLMVSKWDVNMPLYGSNFGTKATPVEKKPQPIKAITVSELDRKIRDGKDKYDYDESLEACAMCNSDINWDDDDGTWHNEGEGYMVCGPCERWLVNSGIERYGDIETAIVISQANGSYVNNW